MTIATAPLAASQSEFDFEAGPHGAGELAVLSFKGTEALNALYSVEVDLVPGPDVVVDAQSLLGEPALLTVQLGDGSARFFHGIIAHWSTWDVGATGERKRHRARVVPRLWTLKYMKRSRIFQNLSVPDIAQKVLKDGNVEFRLALSGSYSKREYCVQYRESNLDFLLRLFEEEGIVFFFEHGQGGHTLVLTDAPSAHEPLVGESKLVFREESRMVAGADSVQTFSSRLEIQPGAVMLRDYNFLTPAVDLSTDAQSDDGDAVLEVYDYPGRYSDAGGGKSYSKIRLEELRARAETATGTSASRRLTPGYVFELDEHPRPALNGEYLILSVSHEGRQPEVLVDVRSVQGGGESSGYRSEFTCQRSSVPFRPERRTERPRIGGAQTAVVVGPAGEEIHTDEHGRIKVQFHWDREGKGDDKSSCWIRVSQAWAGPGWGALYLPRIGQEVVVEFLEGDPDRPLVTGSVYNGHNPPPLSLPDEKTKSTLRSSSSPGGDGFNELRFEDAAGSEEVFFHAQKDFNIVVENDKSQKVGGNETLRVEKDRSREVLGNQKLSVGKDDSSVVGGNQTLDVTKDRSTTVGGNHTEAVTGSQSISVGGTQTTTVTLASTENVGLGKALNVGGGYAINVGAAMNEIVVGLKSEQVGGAKVEMVGAKKSEMVKGSRTMQVGGDLSETVGKKRNLKVTKDFLVNVNAAMTVKAKDTYALGAKEIVLSAEEQFTLKVGSATIQVKKNGDVVIKGAKVEMTASGDIIMKASKIGEN
ncbi:type VI secretion system Vgr family protein [Myxococcus landrumensis]|uniref:Type VI secretion system tip protein VgrG n=1 Tax=Myxococcus landrumensis TaxID=2813577 RepID=A0ABX7N4I5_9BACT|nr:type VI secretion system tip protein VgrG [Myxococcus landrumus]QSQ12499.1 type VI secretion system tip protein VgrG [Myxococcus landrumus]